MEKEPLVIILQFSRMVSRKAVAILLVVHAATMLASQTEAFIPIFTYHELQKMQEKERSNRQKKFPNIWQRSEKEEPSEEEEENFTIQLTAPVEIGMRMNSRQLEKYRAAQEGLRREALPPTQPRKLCGHTSWLEEGSLWRGPLSTLVLIF
ncbi:promotilin isoform X2 [Perognathus longimembris pacificus]|uniref:promotilin isoform X2 n=1 Tax=Perognathus longimembris pacificus TaxID=214514 RepID=UPI00201991DD|nr:promotilin isoform X2 [Perognathus longimembris pacificus]